MDMDCCFVKLTRLLCESCACSVFFHGDGSIKYLNTQEINHPMLLNYVRVAFGHEGLSICMIRNAFPLLEKNGVSVLPFVFEIYGISIMFFIFSMRGA